MTRAGLTPVIFYADDDLDDQNWVEEACRSLEDPIEIRFFNNGRDVISELSITSPESQPSLIVLDLNMPTMDGRQTLKALKKEQKYEDIPVVIVTTSSSQLDKDITMKLGAALYLTKPHDYPQWRDVVKQFNRFL